MQGALAGLDRATRHIVVCAVKDDEGEEVLPERRVAYDALVIAIGSESNDFGTPGVREHAFTIDNAWQAHLFHRRLVNACFHANFANDARVLHLCIVGAGATGVELAAELHNTLRVLTAYGLENFDPERQIRISIVEAGPRILPGLPDHVAEGTMKVLADLGVEVMTGERLVAVTRALVKTAGGRDVQADFTVLAAGIRCADVLQDISRLDDKRLYQP